MLESEMPQRFLPAIRTLVKHKVDFIIIGGVAAVLGGAPVSTFDIDVVHSRDPENVRRLLAALEELDARYQFHQDLRPNESHLLSPGPQLLVTRNGRLDVRGSVGSGRGYPELLPRSVAIEVAQGLWVRVLDLAAVIELKEERGDEKDLGSLPTLRSTLREKRSPTPIPPFPDAVD
jgi:hypothetical protein